MRIEDLDFFYTQIARNRYLDLWLGFGSDRNTATTISLGMRYFKIAWALSFFFVGLQAFAQVEFKTTSPVEYSNHIVEEQEKLGQQFLEFSNILLNSDDYQVNEDKRQLVIKEIELSLRRLRNMAPFENGTKFRNEAIAVFELYRDLHMDDYAKISVLVTNKESSLASLEEYFALQVKAEKKMKEYTSQMRAAQMEFANANKVALVKNPMQDQFDRILESNIYTREVFLAYIAVAKVNEMWWDAMEAGDAEGMEKQRQAILDAAKNCKLANMAGFHGDERFRDAAIERVKHYSDLAADQYQKIALILDSPERTKEDVEFVNGTVDEYNKVNQALNQKFNQAQRELKQNALPTQEAESR